MELRLDPEIPVTRVVNGHNVFNKGYHHGLRGKTYEEYYGKERAVEIRKRHSEALKGHRIGLMETPMPLRVSQSLPKANGIDSIQ